MIAQYFKEVPLSDILTAKQVKDGMTNRTKRSTLEDLVDLLYKNKLISNKSEALTRVMEREELCTTALGNGIAIPHARLQVGEKPVIAVGRHKEGLDFEAPDGKPVHLVFLVLWQPEQPGLFNRLFAGLVGELANPAFREKLLAAKNPAEISKILSSVSIDMVLGRSSKCEADMLIALQLLETKKRAGAKGLENQITLARDELPRSMLSRFDRLLEKCGEALVEAPSGVCGGCHMQLSSSFASEMLKNQDTIYVCERCGRFLIHHIND